MAAFKCPHCKEETISLKDKFILGWWVTINCKQCGGRVAVFPWVLMMMTILHIWNILWWVGMIIFNDSYHYLGYMAVGFIIIELISIYSMPLCRLKKITSS